MSSRQQLFFILGVALLAFGLYAAIRVLTEDDAARIRRAIYAAALGVERRDVARFSDIISSQYQDQDGHTKASLVRLVQDVLRDFRPLRVEIKKLSIDVDQKPAVAKIGFKVIFAQIKDGKNYYEAGKIDAQFVPEGRVWRVRSMTYTSVEDMLFISTVA